MDGADSSDAQAGAGQVQNRGVRLERKLIKIYRKVWQKGNTNPK